LAAISAKFSEIFPPAAKKVIFTFEKSKVSRSITSCSFPLKLILDPALLDLFQNFQYFSTNITSGSNDSYIHDFVEVYTK
jgi:hypothetical protein